MKAVVDNDILLKGACYALLPALESCMGEGESIGVLGTAIFVIPKQLRKKELNRAAEDVEVIFRQFIARHELLEPTAEEQQFAGELEFAAQEMSLNLDTGESQLASICVIRTVPLLVTGDKRAIISLERLLDSVARLKSIEARVLCLEQLLLRLIASPSAGDSPGDAVCAEPRVDLALSICFGCYSPDSPSSDPGAMLKMYIEDLRRDTPRILAIS